MSSVTLHPVMKAIIQQASVSMDAPTTMSDSSGFAVAMCYGGGATVNLTLRVFAEEDLTELWRLLRPGAVLSDLGISDGSVKQTKLSLPGRKLCLD